MFLSGKGLRVMMPLLMLIAFFGCLFLALDSLVFALMAFTQITLYSMAAHQLLLMPKHSNRLSRTLSYIVSGHLASLIGALSYLFGHKNAHHH